MAGTGSFPISITWQVGNTTAPLQSVNQVQSAFGNLQRTAQQTSGSMGTLAQGMTPLTSATKQFGGAIGTASSQSAQFAGAMGQSNNAIKGVSGSLTQHNTLLGQGNKVRQKDIGAIKAHSQSIVSQVGSVTGLSFAFTGLFTAMGEAQGMQELLALQEQKVSDEQANLNALVEAGITSGREYTQQQARLEKAQRGLAFQTRTTNLSIQDQFFFIASIAGQMLPRAVTGFTKLREVQASAANQGKSLVGVLRDIIGTKFGTVAQTFTGAMGRLPDLFNKATISVRGFTFSVRTMTLAFAPLAIVSGVLIAISQNLFGLRDAMNAAGEAIGNAIPFLKPLLEGIKAVGEAIGLTGEQSVQASQQVSGSLEVMEKDGIKRIGGIIVTVDELGRSIKDQLPKEVQAAVDIVDPEVQRLTNSLFLMTTGLQTTGSEFERLLLGPMTTGVDVIKSLTGELIKEDEAFRKNLVTTKSFNEVLPRFASDLGEVGNQLIISKDAAGDWHATAGTAQVIANKLGITVDELAAMLNTAAKSGSNANASFEIIEGTLGLVTGETETAAVGFTNLAQKQALAREAAERTIPGFENLSKTTQDYIIQQKLAAPAIEKTNEAMVKGFETIKTGIDPTADLATRYEQFKDSLDVTTPSLDEVTAGLNRETGAILQMTNALAPAIEQIESSAEGMKDQKSVLDELPDSFKASANSIILMKNGLAEIITPGQLVNTILSDQQNELANVNGLMDLWSQNLQSAGISLVDYIATLSQLGIIDSETAKALEEKGKALGLITEATEKHKTVTQELVESNEDLLTSLQEVNQGFRDGSLTAELLRKGTLEAQKVFSDLSQEMIQTSAFVSQYRTELNDTNNQQKLFIQGVLNTEQAFLESVAAILTVNGELQRYAERLADGSEGQVAFFEGQQKIIRATLDSIRNITDLAGQISILNQFLEDGFAQTVAFAEGLLKGKLAASELKTEIAAANGEWLGFRDALISANPELQKFGDLTGFTNEQLVEMARVMGGSREAIRALTEETMKAAAAFADWISNTDFDDLDDEFEETVENFREGLEEMAEDAEQNGVKISDKFLQALDFEGVKQAAGEQMQELWPLVAQSVEAGMAAADPSFIDQGVQLFTNEIKQSLEKADVEGSAKAVVDGILRELANLKNIEDPVELQQTMQNIKDKIDALATGTDRLEDTTNAITSLTQVSPANLKTIAQEIASFADTINTLDITLTPAQIDAWAQSLSQLTGAPVDQLKTQLEQKLRETGQSATDKLLEAGPGGQAARIALGQQMADLAAVFTAFQEDVGAVFRNIVRLEGALLVDTQNFTGIIAVLLRTNLNEWGTWGNNIGIVLTSIGTFLTTFVEETIPTFSETLATALRTNLNEWGTWGNEIGIVFTTIKTFLTTFIEETMPTFTETLAELLRTNIDEWGEWANNILTATEIAGNNAETMTSRTETMTSNVASTLRSNIDDWGSWANDVQTAADHAASSVGSAMSSIVSQAKRAIRAVNSLQSAINSLEGKTIEIRIVRRFITIGSPFSFQHGGSFIVDKPTTIAGKQVGEFSKPELVTVTPLTNPNNINDKNINIGSVKRAVSADTRGRGKSIKKEVLEPINVIVDGEVIMRLVQKRLLEFAGDNII